MRSIHLSNGQGLPVGNIQRSPSHYQPFGRLATQCSQQTQSLADLKFFQIDVGETAARPHQRFVDVPAIREVGREDDLLPVS